MPRSKQSKPDLLLTRRRRMANAALWRRVCPDLARVPDRLRYKISRARNGTAPSPTEDLEELIPSLTPAQAALLIEYLEDVVAEHHGAAATPVDVAFDSEQRLDGDEDVAQVRASREPAAYGLWYERSLAHAAAARAARVAVRRAMNQPAWAA